MRDKLLVFLYKRQITYSLWWTFSYSCYSNMMYLFIDKWETITCFSASLFDIFSHYICISDVIPIISVFLQMLVIWDRSDYVTIYLNYQPSHVSLLAPSQLTFRHTENGSQVDKALHVWSSGLSHLNVAGSNPALNKENSKANSTRGCREKAVAC